MKKIFMLFPGFLFLGAIGAYAQEDVISPDYVGTGTYHGLSAPLRDIP